MCLEAALELSEPLLSGGDGPRPGTPLGSQPARAAEVATAEQAVAAAREVALGLVCTRMPRPPAALVWVADEEDDGDVELEEEAGSSTKTFQEGLMRDRGRNGEELPERQVEDGRGGKRGMLLADFAPRDGWAQSGLLGEAELKAAHKAARKAERKAKVHQPLKPHGYGDGWSECSCRRCERSLTLEEKAEAAYQAWKDAVAEARA